jgi:hypothetical protein
VPTEPRRPRRIAALVLVWALAVPVAAALGVFALRAAGGDSSATVLSAAEAASLATAAPSPTPGAAPPVATPVPPSATADPTAGAVVQRRVPGAVLGLRCELGVPVLVWSVPDPGWRVEEVDAEDDGLRVRLEADERRVRLTIECTDGEPVVAAAAPDD